MTICDEIHAFCLYFLRNVRACYIPYYDLYNMIARTGRNVIRPFRRSQNIMIKFSHRVIKLKIKTIFFEIKTEQFSAQYFIVYNEMRAARLFMYILYTGRQLRRNHSYIIKNRHNFVNYILRLPPIYMYIISFCPFFYEPFE